MWNFEDLKKQMNDYFDNISKEQFLKDVDDAGCSDWIEEVEPIQWVTCEVIKECGYHDVHEIGEIISVDHNHLDEMIYKGYVKVIEEEKSFHEQN